MKSVLLLPGKPTRERYENPELPKPHEANWFPRIRDALAMRAIVTGVAVFPRPYDPIYEDWKEVVEMYGTDTDMSVVGHSAGAEFALRWLSENKTIRLRQLILVAPWTDASRKYGDFSDYDLDLTLPNRIGRISIFHSTDDSDAIKSNVAYLKDALPAAHYKEFTKHGHFMIGNNMESAEFPELLEELLQDHISTDYTGVRL